MVTHILSIYIYIYQLAYLCIHVFKRWIPFIHLQLDISKSGDTKDNLSGPLRAALVKLPPPWEFQSRKLRPQTSHDCPTNPFPSCTKNEVYINSSKNMTSHINCIPHQLHPTLIPFQKTSRSFLICWEIKRQKKHTVFAAATIPNKYRDDWD